MLLPSPNQRWQPKKQRRVYRRLQKRRLRHHGGRDGNTGAMGLTPNKMGVGKSSTHPIQPGGCQCCMLVLMTQWAIKRAERV